MKATDDKGKRSTQDTKSKTPTAKPNNPQQPERKETPGKTPLSPPFGDPQKNTPEKWPGTTTTGHPKHDSDSDYNTGEVHEEDMEEQGVEEREEK